VSVFTEMESEVRSYCRQWPAVFATARGHLLCDEDGREYIDFFSGAGALNYGSNDPRIMQPLTEYLRQGGILHSLDMSTAAKRAFLETLRDVILEPRGLDYRVQFPGPTGTNSVEAALKLARKVTGRQLIISFTNAFHGMTLGSLAVTGSEAKRRGAGIPLPHARAMPFDGFLGGDVDTLDYLEAFLDDSSSGVDHPAAMIVETVQGEGGVNVARRDWLRRLASICRERQILLIVDDVQMGCGRTGSFFSFEDAGIEPDIVCLSKSLSGSGLPFALVLIRPELDVWDPGEHNGTFRGNNAAFVTATAALSEYWRDDALTRRVQEGGETIHETLGGIVARHPDAFDPPRGRGMIWGLPCRDPELADRIVAAAFAEGLILETSGSDGEVVKLLPALTTPAEALAEGLKRLAHCVKACLDRDGGWR
jgi:diaminobutyrate-2-oxoglutarate transaminase